MARLNADGLPPRVAVFVQEYVKDGNGGGAARRAGYAPANADVQASKLLTNPKVKAAVAKYMAKASEAAEVDAAWVRRELKRVYDLALAKEQFGKPNPDLVNATRALENLGRLTAVGAFTDRSDVTTKGKSIKPAKKQIMII